MEKEKIVDQCKSDALALLHCFNEAEEGEQIKLLGDLWFKGFAMGHADAKNEIEPILKSVSSELSKLVVAYMAGDQARLNLIFDDFIKRHIAVRNAGDQAKVH